MRRILLTVALLGIAVSAGAQAPTSKPNLLGIKGYAGHNTERTANGVRMTGKTIVWFESGARVYSDEGATIDFQANQIEFRGKVVMTHSY